jgi:rhodanese-related sulfurtransferase
MSKHRKHRNLSVDASKPTPTAVPFESTSPVTSSRDSVARRVVWQLVAVFGASIVLGFAFNASSPVGVRLSDASSEPGAATTTLTNLVSVSSVAVPANHLALLPPTPPPPIAPPVVKRATIPAPPPTPIPATAQVPISQSPVTPPVAVPHAVTTTLAAPTTPPAALNPAPIHWLQAKPLVATGQAVLVDVRAKGMYDAGHIPDAISLPETSSPEEFTAFLNQHPTNHTLIVYCSSISCSQSARVASRLVTQYQRPSVKYMTGGYLEYQQEQAKNPAGTTP